MTFGASAAELVWRPSFTYVDCDVPQSFTLILPQRAWAYRAMAVGGHDVATSGVDESFVLRHDRAYRLTIRCTETEWVESLEPMIKVLWAQAQAFTIRFDQADAATDETVRLVSPWMDEGVEPTPVEPGGVLEFELVVRSDDGSALPYPYFAEA